jgi:hypothetical protein
VNKQQFRTIVKNYTSLEKGEAVDLISLSQHYPYSQLIHNLAARGAQDYELAEKDSSLHVSAIYSTDRSVLKLIMVATKQPRMVIEEKTIEPLSIKSEGIADNLVIPTTPLSGEALYSEVAQDLKHLTESKLKFEEMVERLEKESAKPLINTVSKATKSIANEVIESVKPSKQKVKAEDTKQKEQVEIIDEFIKAQPSITPAKQAELKNEDLSDKYDVYGENIVSETLVEILLKQGKKEKAIEMLKKLIWKFPQKKTYFAAQIEELKK